MAELNLPTEVCCLGNASRWILRAIFLCIKKLGAGFEPATFGFTRRRYCSPILCFRNHSQPQTQKTALMKNQRGVGKERDSRNQSSIYSSSRTAKVKAPVLRSAKLLTTMRYVPVVVG